ncbi:hypothetical protein [Streptomyces gobiensis]|uniref:hypothetical protein n=1 Tax=Streptomyces gobiensis TaxID=2875706 RepID=UPI001E2DC915|nr:hypothetical protein [Streptomyces gobiensis]UGY94722.1 hypothetical protein test1122_25295 [Streptomyces gobiensis]
MVEPEFDATGVRIGRWLRSLTRGGQVLVRDGRLVLLTSYGREIDSAPVEQVRVSSPWYAARDRAMATINGTHYALRLAAPSRERLLAAVREARERAAKIATQRRIVHP